MQDYYEITVPPASLPVTREEAKSFARDIPDADNDIVDELIESATYDGEYYTGRHFVQRTVTGYFDNLYASRFEPLPYLEVRAAPVISVSSVSYNDGSGWVLIDSADYELKQKYGYPRILFNQQPVPGAQVAYKYKVVFVSGYTTIPSGVKLAIKQHILFLYENRGDVAPDGRITMPIETRGIYDRRFKIKRVF